MDLSSTKRMGAMAINVKRKGETANRWKGNAWDPRLLFDSEKKNVQITFSIASKGGGTTEVMAQLDGESFGNLAFAMIHADPEAAIEAFETAMKPRHRYRPGLHLVATG
jgi:hypothetical protein